MKSVQVLSYIVDSSGKWCALSGITSPDGGATVKGCIQLYCVDKAAHQDIEGKDWTIGHRLRALFCRR
jgi:clathrin heavy chain